MEQLEFKFDKREVLEDKLKREYAEFKALDKVWDAGRFSEKHEPNPSWREKNAFYVPEKGRSWEIKKLLTKMYPNSKSDIRKMNKNQAYKFYVGILTYITKIKRIFRE